MQEFGGWDAKLLFKTFGEVGQVLEPYLICNLTYVTGFLFKKLSGPFKPENSNELIGRLINKRYELSVKVFSAHAYFHAKRFDRKTGI